MPNLKTFLKEDGELRLVQWATRLRSVAGGELLKVDPTPRPIQMAHSHATGEGLVSNGYLGADVIRLESGTGFLPHTHPGDHLLIVVYGEGTMTYGGKIYPTRAGQIYMVEGSIPHAVGAITDHVIVAIGAPHRAVGDPDRMAVVEYQEVLSDIGELHCLICDRHAVAPLRLHEVDCTHCPCPECMA